MSKEAQAKWREAKNIIEFAKTIAKDYKGNAALNMASKYENFSGFNRASLAHLLSEALRDGKPIKEDTLEKTFKKIIERNPKAALNVDADNIILRGTRLNGGNYDKVKPGWLSSGAGYYGDKVSHGTHSSMIARKYGMLDEVTHRANIFTAFKGTPHQRVVPDFYMEKVLAGPIKDDPGSKMYTEFRDNIKSYKKLKELKDDYESAIGSSYETPVMPATRDRAPNASGVRWVMPKIPMGKIRCSAKAVMVLSRM